MSCFRKLRNSIERLKSLKERYLAKSPLDKWLFVRRINVLLLKHVGCQFMDERTKIHLRTFIPMYLGLNIFTCMFYTLYYYRAEPFKGLRSTPILGLLIPSFILYFIFLHPSSRKKFQHIYNFSGVYIYANSKSSPRNNLIRNRMAIRLLANSIEISALVAIALALSLGPALYEVVFNQKQDLMLYFILPFIDPETQSGFYINFANQLFICAYGVVLIPGIELVTCIFKNNVSITAAVIENALLEFTILLEKDENLSDAYNWNFRNIVLQILDFDRLVVDLFNLLYWKFFLQPFVLMYSITLSLLLYLTGHYSGGIGFALCCYVQLLILCDVGKIVDDANNLILDNLNRFPYYVLPLKKQEMFSLLLNRMQNGAKIQIGPLAELNYETATKLTKTIYTYVMLMLRAVIRTISY